MSSSSWFDIGRTLNFSLVILHAQKQPPVVLYKKGVLKNFAKLTGKHLCQTLFFNKVTTLFKKRLWHRCFPVTFAKSLRTPFLRSNSGVLLLHSTLFMICWTSNKFLPSSVKELQHNNLIKYYLDLGLFAKSLPISIFWSKPLYEIYGKVLPPRVSAFYTSPDLLVVRNFNNNCLILVVVCRSSFLATTFSQSR